MFWLVVAVAAGVGVFLIYRSSPRPGPVRPMPPPEAAAKSSGAEPSSAPRSLEWLIELPERIRVARGEAEQLAARSLYEDALARLAHERRTAPHNLELKEAMATLYLDRKQFEEARRLFAELIEARPQDPGLRLKMAQTLMQLGEFRDAYEAVRWYLRDVPNHAAGQKLAARICLDGGWPDQALRHLRVLVDTRQDDTETRQLLAVTYLRLEQFARAISQFDELIRSTPADPSNYYNMALAYARQQLPTETLKVLTKAVENFGARTVAQWMGEPDFQPLHDHPVFRTYRDQLVRQQTPDVVSLAPRSSMVGEKQIGWMPEPVLDPLPKLAPR